jgi:hypothetical protein
MSEERRNRLIPARRRALLTRYQASGEKQRAFCESAGVSVSTLQYWLQQERLTGALSEVTPPTPTKTTLEFVIPRRYGSSSTERVMWWREEPKKIFAFPLFPCTGATFCRAHSEERSILPL